MDQTLIDKCYQVAKEKLLPRWIGDVEMTSPPARWGTSYALVSSTTVESKVVPRSACHASIGVLSTETRKRYRAIITLAIPVEVGERIGWSSKELLDYYRYIANEGPVKHMFVTKDPEVMTSQGIILDLAEDKGTHLLMALLQTRLPWEITIREDGIKRFNYLLSRGVAPALSFIISVGIYGGMLAPSYVGFNHSPYKWGDFNNEQFKKLLLDIPSDTSVPPYYEGGWYGAFKLFGGAEEDTVTVAIIRKVGKILSIQQKPLASFATVGGSPPKVSKEDVILQQLGDYLLEVQNQILTLHKYKQTWKGL